MDDLRLAEIAATSTDDLDLLDRVLSEVQAPAAPAGGTPGPGRTRAAILARRIIGLVYERREADGSLGEVESALDDVGAPAPEEGLAFATRGAVLAHRLRAALDAETRETADPDRHRARGWAVQTHRILDGLGIVRRDAGGADLPIVDRIRLLVARNTDDLQSIVETLDRIGAPVAPVELEDDSSPIRRIRARIERLAQERAGFVYRAILDALTQVEPEGIASGLSGTTPIPQGLATADEIVARIRRLGEWAVAPGTGVNTALRAVDAALSAAGAPPAPDGLPPATSADRALDAIRVRIRLLGDDRNAAGLELGRIEIALDDAEAPSLASTPFDTTAERLIARIGALRDADARDWSDRTRTRERDLLGEIQAALNAAGAPVVVADPRDPSRPAGLTTASLAERIRRLAEQAGGAQTFRARVQAVLDEVHAPAVPAEFAKDPNPSIRRIRLLAEHGPIGAPSRDNICRLAESAVLSQIGEFLTEIGAPSVSTAEAVLSQTPGLDVIRRRIRLLVERRDTGLQSIVETLDEIDAPPGPRAFADDAEPYRRIIGRIRGLGGLAQARAGDLAQVEQALRSVGSPVALPGERAGLDYAERIRRLGGRGETDDLTEGVLRALDAELDRVGAPTIEGTCLRSVNIARRIQALGAQALGAQALAPVIQFLDTVGAPPPRLGPETSPTPLAQVQNRIQALAAEAGTTTLLAALVRTLDEAGAPPARTPSAPTLSPDLAGLGMIRNRIGGLADLRDKALADIRAIENRLNIRCAPDGGPLAGRTRGEALADRIDGLMVVEAGKAEAAAVKVARSWEADLVLVAAALDGDAVRHPTVAAASPRARAMEARIRTRNDLLARASGENEAVAQALDDLGVGGDWDNLAARVRDLGGRTDRLAQSIENVLDDLQAPPVPVEGMEVAAVVRRRIVSLLSLRHPVGILTDIEEAMDAAGLPAGLPDARGTIESILARLVHTGRRGLFAQAIAESLDKALDDLGVPPRNPALASFPVAEQIARRVLELRNDLSTEIRTAEVRLSNLVAALDATLDDIGAPVAGPEIVAQDPAPRLSRRILDAVAQARTPLQSGPSLRSLGDLARAMSRRVVEAPPEARVPYLARILQALRDYRTGEVGLATIKDAVDASPVRAFVLAILNDLDLVSGPQSSPVVDTSALDGIAQAARDLRMVLDSASVPSAGGQDVRGALVRVGDLVAQARDSLPQNSAAARSLLQAASALLSQALAQSPDL